MFLTCDRCGQPLEIGNEALVIAPAQREYHAERQVFRMCEACWPLLRQWMHGGTKHPLVHILLTGRALCGFPGTPNQWPEGNTWVIRSDAHEATCVECIKQSKSIGG